MVFPNLSSASSNSSFSLNHCHRHINTQKFFSSEKQNVNLEGIMLGELSQADKDKYRTISLICRILNKEKSPREALQKIIHTYSLYSFNFFFLKKTDFIYLFAERGEGQEKERERHALTGDRTCNPGRCPDQKSNGHPFALKDAPNRPRDTSQGLLLQLQSFRASSPQSALYLHDATKLTPEKINSSLWILLLY